MSDTTIETLPRLNCDAIESQTQHFDWQSATMEDFCEDPDAITWRFWEAVVPEDGDDATCGHCQEPFQYNGDQEEWVHAGFDVPSASCDDDDNAPYAEPDDDYRRDEREGPMMSYWYPVDIRYPDEAAVKIADLPLCVVQVGDEMGLALTGGGMDLSWEICEAFIRLGFYPPFHFAQNLPKMAMRYTDTHRLTVAFCRESCRIMAGWAESGLRRLDDVESWMVEYNNRA